MPGLEIDNLVTPEVSCDRPQLKAHKALPRKREQPLNSYPSIPTHKPRMQSLHDEYNSPSLALTSNLTPPPSRSDADLQITPPSNIRSANGRTRLKISPDHTTKANGRVYALQHPDPSTPVNQQSPPTPETTPPKASVKPATLQAPPAQRHPSSRAESFKTARENLSSDEDSSRRREQPSQIARQNWLDATRSARLKDIGLGLGLESDNEETTPTMRSPIRAVSKSSFVTFDGAWGGEDSNVADSTFRLREWDDNLMRNVTVRKRSHKRPRVAPQPMHDPQNPVEIRDGNLSRGTSLRERIERRRHSPTSASTERFGEEIEWPSAVDNLVDDGGPSDADLKRLSVMSNTSTVVEAMVVDTVPQRRRTLRHTGRNLAFRERALIFDPPNGRPTTSYERQHRLVHKTSRVPIRGYGGSISDVSASVRPTTSRDQQDTIPVIVIPTRRSSLKSSSASSREQSRSHSLTSTHQQHRAITTPNGGAGYFDIPLRRRRPLSESMSPEGAYPDGRRFLDYAPWVPKKRSSLSASTSRSTSPTSASIKSRKRNVVAIHRRAISQLTSPDRNGSSADQRMASGWSFLRPPAAQITPFSQPSITSSSPEAHEVSQATAVSLFPHNNQSLLIVQQRARPILEIPRHLLASSEQFPDDEEPLTPPPTIGYPEPLVESPLKNPRKPPEPPVFKIIPPTPANNTPTSDADRNRPSTASKTRPGSGTLSLVRRALSARRYSESFISPFSRLPRSKAAKDPVPIVPAEKDSKLHPFWRPRAFWDNLSDSDSDEDFGNEGFLMGDEVIDRRRPSNTPTNNSTPKRSISLSFPSKLQPQNRSRAQKQHNESDSDSEGLGNEGFLISNALAKSQQRHRASKPKPRPNVTPQRRLSLPLRLHTQNGTLHRRESGGSIHRAEKGGATASRTSTNKESQDGFLSLAGLQQRFRLSKEKREHQKREKDRARLRSSIGARIVVPDARVI